MSSWSGPESGQTLLFTPGRSLLHRANPLTTLVGLLWVISAAAILPTVGTTLLTVAEVAFAFGAGVGPPVAKRLIIILVPFGVALFVVHGLLVKSPDAIRFGAIALSPSGLAYAAQLFTRLSAMLTGSLLFVTTTHPSDMLKSLDARGVSPAVSYLIASPLLLLEPLSNRARAVQDAQRARGMDLTGSWRARIRALPALLIPLIALALCDLDHRVLILDGRAFRAEKRRTVLDAPPDDVGQRRLRRVLIVVVVLQLGLLVLWR